MILDKKLYFELIETYKKITSKKHYSLYNLLKTFADYMISYSQRSIGKTTAFVILALIIFQISDKEISSAYIRRWETDLKGKYNISSLIDGVIDYGYLKMIYGDDYNSIVYKNYKFYLAFKENDEYTKIDDIPFLQLFAINSEEHYKSTQYPRIKLIAFDEFIARDFYIENEFILFMNLLSTIIREKTDVKIFMFGNSINLYNPYFKNMNLKNTTNQVMGSIDIYNFTNQNNDNLVIACEYAVTKNKKQKHNKYFNFDNSKLEMITNGKWEIGVYQRLPHKFYITDIKYIFYIEFEENILQCEIVKSKKLRKYFIFVHRKTTPIKDDNKRLVYSNKTNSKYNYHYNIYNADNQLKVMIKDLIISNNVYFQDNEIGNIFENYLNTCKENLI